MVKKRQETFKCSHCGKDFPMPVRWCAKCEGHLSGHSWYGKADACDACTSGANDRYIEWKKGHAERVAKAIAEANTPERIAAGKKAAADYVAWLESEAGKNRFNR